MWYREKRKVLGILMMLPPCFVDCCKTSSSFNILKISSFLHLGVVCIFNDQVIVLDIRHK